MLEHKFKPNKEKLGLTDIVINIKEKSPDYVDSAKESISRFPQIYYNEYELENTSIENFSMDFNGFVPILTMSYTDLRSSIYKYGLPIDDSRIKVMYPSNNKALGNILMEFKIESYDSESIGNNNIKKYNFVCILSLNRLLTSEYKVYPEMSSYQVFEEFARTSGLGFVSNVSATNDKMNWTNFGERNMDFLESVRDHAWIGENNFVWAYIDPFYNLVYVDVEKALTQDMTEIVWSMDDVFSQENQPNDNVISGPPVLSTNDSYKTTNIFVFDYFIKNNSTQISLENGYTRNIHYYDVDGNWKERAGHYHKYTLDTISTPGSESTKIYTKSLDDEFYSLNKREVFAGIMDTKNVHPDFLWARLQNSENVVDMQKFIVQAMLPAQNMNIKRFEMVQLQDRDNTENASTMENSQNSTQLTNNYLCIGYSLIFNIDSVGMYVNLISREISIPS